MMGNYAIRKKIRALLLVVIMLGLCSCASAYYLNIDAPSNLRVGEDIYFEGSTNTPSPDVIDIVFSRVSTGPIEIDRISIPIEDRTETIFNGTFSTSGLEAGRYRIEGISGSKRNFSGDSRILRVVTLEDRTNDVAFTSQREQWIPDVLTIAGSIRDFKDTSVTFELRMDGEMVFGPASVPVSHGRFDYTIPVSELGTYMLSIFDYRGLIGEYEFVLRAQHGGAAVSQEEIVRPTVQPIQTEPVVSTETSSQTPTAAATIMATSVSTPVPVEETSADIQYHARLSRAEAGFYTFKPSDDIVTITTSTGVDWAIEYIDPITQSKHRVNDADAHNAESVTISTGGSLVYVKIYPYSFSEVADITISGTGIASISSDNKARIALGAPPSSSLEETIVHANQDSDSAPASPLSIITLLFGCGVGVLLFLRRNF
jgi:hypothetical protein